MALLLVKLFCLLFVYCVFADAEIAVTSGKHYLFVTMYHRSHWGFQVEIARELYNRGNQITFLLPEEFEGTENPPHDLLDFATILVKSVGYGPKEMQQICKTWSEAEGFEEFTAIFGLLDIMSEGWVYTFHALLEEAERTKIDVIISDKNPAVVAICNHLKGIECINTTPLVLRNPDSESVSLGVGVIPVWLPATAVGKPIAHTLMERIEQQIIISFSKIAEKIIFPMAASRIIEALKDKGISVTAEDLSTTFPTLINSFQGLDWNIALPPHSKYVGPMNLEYIEETRDEYRIKHTYYQKILADASLDVHDEQFQFTELEHFLERHEHIVVISFGKSVELSQDQVSELVSFCSLVQPIPVLWTIRKRHLYLLEPFSLPDNLRVETWVNLIGTMSHPNVALLISQCGVATAHEAILTQTPLLCVPFLYDQFDIVSLVMHHHLGEMVSKGAMTGLALFDMVQSMIPKKEWYQENAAPLIQMARLKPSLSHVAQWIETIADVGDQFFLPPINGIDLSFYEYRELYFIVPFIIFAVILGIKSCCINCCCRNRHAKPSK